MCQTVCHRALVSSGAEFYARRGRVRLVDKSPTLLTGAESGVRPLIIGIWVQLHGETTGAEWNLLAALAAQGQHANGRGVEAIDPLRALAERRRLAIRASDDESQRSFQPGRASHGPS